MRQLALKAFCVFLWLFTFALTANLAVSAPAFARAGGGGGGSSGSSGSSRYSGPVKLVFAAATLIALGCINIRLNKQAKKVSTALKVMEQREPQWSQNGLEAVVTQKFHCLQSAWSRQDLAEMRRHLHPTLYPEWEALIADQRRHNQRNHIQDSQIKKMRFVSAQNFSDNERDNFTVCIDGVCCEATVSLDAYPPADPRVARHELKTAKFREFWTFEWEGSDWKLLRVDQFGAWSHWVKAEIIHETLVA